MSDQLAYDYDHSKATVTELTNKLLYLQDKSALYVPGLPLSQTQKKWKLIAALEKHYALQREHLNINVKDYLHLCYEKTYRNKVTCPELRNILSQYDIVYPDEPSRAQLLELLEKNILTLRMSNYCQTADRARRVAEKARQKAENELKKIKNDQKDAEAIDNDVDDDSSGEDGEYDYKQGRGAWAIWEGKSLNSHVLIAAVAFAPSVAMWLLK